MSSDIKLSIQYDGGDKNPFVPSAGDVVGQCPHTPRPLHTQFFVERDWPIVGGTAVRWLNLCRACGASDTLPELSLHLWTVEDAQRVAQAAVLQ